MSDNTIQIEGLRDFSKNLGKSSVKVGKKLAKNVLKNPGRALESAANVGTVFASPSPKAALSSLPEVIILYHARKRLKSWKICSILYHLHGTKNRKIIPICTTKVKINPKRNIQNIKY